MGRYLIDGDVSVDDRLQRIMLEAHRPSCLAEYSRSSSCPSRSCNEQITFAMEVRVKQESQDEALVPLCTGTNSQSDDHVNGASSSSSCSASPSGTSSGDGGGSCSDVGGGGGGGTMPGPMQKVPSLSDLSDPESSLGKS